MLSIFCCLILVLCGVSSQTPTRCHSPKQMQFRMTIADHIKNTLTLSTVEYDAPNERVAFTDENVFSTTRQRHTQIYLYRENTIYDINQLTRKCTKRPIGMPFRPYDIPANATFMGDLVEGGPGEELFAQSWRAVEGAMWIGIFSRLNCFPITMHHLDAKSHWEGNTMDINDVVAGIYNPGAFVPPAECYK